MIHDLSALQTSLTRMISFVLSHKLIMSEKFHSKNSCTGHLTLRVYCKFSFEALRILRLVPGAFLSRASGCFGVGCIPKNLRWKAEATSGGRKSPVLSTIIQTIQAYALSAVGSSSANLHSGYWRRV